MTKQKLPEAGQRVGVVCGPGEFPQDRSGLVIGIIPSQWGDYALVLMDDGTTRRCHGMNDGPGIGWHYVEGGR